MSVFVIFFLVLQTLVDGFLQKFRTYFFVFFELGGFLAHFICFLPEGKCGQAADQIMPVFMAEQSFADFILDMPTLFENGTDNFHMESSPFDTEN